MTLKMYICPNFNLYSGFWCGKKECSARLSLRSNHLLIMVMFSTPVHQHTYQPVTWNYFGQTFSFSIIINWSVVCVPAWIFYLHCRYNIYISVSLQHFHTLCSVIHIPQLLVHTHPAKTITITPFCYESTWNSPNQTATAGLRPLLGKKKSG